MKLLSGNHSYETDEQQQAKGQRLADTDRVVELSEQRGEEYAGAN
jgi:hypothetical protein